MKLIDLNPRWFVLEDNGPRVGLTFKCPHCLTQRLGVVFHHDGYQAIEDSYILARHGAADTNHIWTMVGDSFDVLSLSPSVDTSSSGHWHGFVKDGYIQ